jgi:hypothetical protein
MLALLILGPSAWADFTLNFTGSQVYPADTPIGIGVIGLNGVKLTNTIQQYSSYGVNFYSGAISTLKTYPWFPNYTFHDSVGSTVTTFMGPTFDTPTDWINRQNGSQSTYPSAADTPTTDFLGFDKNDTTTPAIDSGTVMKFDSPIYSLSLNLSRPGKNAGNIAELYIYLFNSTAAGGTKLVASTLQFTVYTGGAGTPEWVTYNSPPAGAFDVVVIYSSDRFMCDNLSVSSNPVSGLPKLETPTLLSPANHTNFQNLPRTTSVAWSPITGAAGYSVTLEYSSTGAKGSFTPVAGSPFSATDTAYEIPSLEFDATGDGYYEWYVTAIGDDTTHEDSKPSTPLYFSYSTVVLATPKPISPHDGAIFYDSNPREATLAWGPLPTATEGYSVYIEFYDPSTRKWTALSGSPFSPASPTWQNSSFTFTATAEGEYRWAVQAVGDGATSPAPTDSKPKEWSRLTFEK